MTAAKDYSHTSPLEHFQSSSSVHQWFKPDIDRDRLLVLMRRSNGRATRDLLLWVGLVVLAAWWLIETWASIWSFPAALVYGVLYGSASDARWHECGHRTAFASKRANDIVYHFASFMVLREPISWRRSHTRHHAETIVVGRDPEIAFPRPTSRRRIVAELFGLLSAAQEFRKYAYALIGRLPSDVETYTPGREKSRVILWARIHVLVHGVVIVSCILTKSLLPWMLIGLPSLYGRWLLFILGATQHAGLEEDVRDHRMNTRSVRMNPVIRFLYSNMNYHLEHHLFPAVPYHRLADLHIDLKDQIPAPYPSLWSALRDASSRVRRIRSEYST
jgi:fatty acid desaturase